MKTNPRFALLAPLNPRIQLPCKLLAPIRSPRLTPLRPAGAGLALAMTLAVAAAQTCEVIHSFGILTNMTGRKPLVLVQASDGTLYGAGLGEFKVTGVLFKMQPDGTGFTVMKYLTNNLGGETPQLIVSGTTVFGLTRGGGDYGKGSVFKLNTDGGGFTTLKHFAGSDGNTPWSLMLSPSGTTLYGTTMSGGSSDKGTVYKLNTDGSSFNVLKHFASSDGYGPTYLKLDSSGTTIYGSTTWGGANGKGVIYKINTDGTDFNVLRHFAVTNNYPFLQWASGNVLYGFTGYSSGNNNGTIFKLNTDGTGYTMIKSCSDGTPGGFMFLSGSTLYWTSVSSSSYGRLFRIATDGSNYSIVKTFTGDQKEVTLRALSDNTFYGTTAGGAAQAGTVFRLNIDGSGWTDLKTFAVSDGHRPQAGLLLSGTTLYGTTAYGGDGTGAGTVYKVNTDGGGYRVIKIFTKDNGQNPCGTLAQAGSTLYGTTFSGGSSGKGTVFKINTDGSGFTVLKHFGGADGEQPGAGLTVGGDLMYGTTETGGTTGLGTLFMLNTNGNGYTVLHHFTETNGILPRGRLLVTGGTIFGAAAQGGTNSGGVVFKINTDGSGYTVLKNFGGSIGSLVQGGLVLADATLYGTTVNGGFVEDAGTVFKLNTNGSGFTVLHRFTNGDGAHPKGELALFGSTLYGTTQSGGGSGYGTAFKINTDGSDFTLLQEFTGGSDGRTPWSGLVGNSAALYGTTENGGDLDAGVVFKLSLATAVSLANPTFDGRDFTFSFPSQSGQSYTVEYNDNLGSPNWMFHHAVTGNGMVVSCVVPTTNATSRFYRVRTP